VVDTDRHERVSFEDIATATARVGGKIDLRSDTVTRPTPLMRAAIANAEVGDDVFGEDPTVRQLEERVAELLGKEAALFVPTGTMANQIALRAHLRPGDEVIIGRDAHCWRHESGALAALAGAQTQQLGEDGTFTGDDVRAAFRPDEPYVSPTRVVAVENTHNMAGGAVWNPKRLEGVLKVAKELGMATHLDGARIWHAAVVTGMTVLELSAGFDTVSVCLSKGLGAPAGSLVAGTRLVIQRCHRFRKMYGGGMRQSGMLAAAGLHALQYHRERLSEDHANASALAEAVGLNPVNVQTNIVMIDVPRNKAAKVIAAARDRGVLVGAATPHRVRAVTHLDVDRDACVKAGAILSDIIADL
jgi:threonine aldolase